MNCSIWSKPISWLRIKASKGKWLQRIVCRSAIENCGWLQTVVTQSACSCSIIYCRCVQPVARGQDACVLLAAANVLGVLPKLPLISDMCDIWLYVTALMNNPGGRECGRMTPWLPCGGPQKLWLIFWQRLDTYDLVQWLQSAQTHTLILFISTRHKHRKSTCMRAAVVRTVEKRLVGLIS